MQIMAWLWYRVRGAQEVDSGDAESPVEKIIREAQLRGDFDRLPGAGRPLNLAENPWVHPDWRPAYDMLASTGYAPAVVEEDKAIRESILNLERRLERFAVHWRSLSPAERASRTEARERFLAEYMDEVRGINRRVEGFNITAPGAMHRGTLLPGPVLRSAEAQLPLT
jgi:DnaJ family protein C protein 28